MFTSIKGRTVIVTGSSRGIAGIFPAAKLGAMTEADFDLVLDTNLKGTFLSVSACLPAMKAKQFGRIILTSSITGPVTGFPGWSHYGASKAGRKRQCRCAAWALSPTLPMRRCFSRALRPLTSQARAWLSMAARFSPKGLPRWRTREAVVLLGHSP